LVSFLNYIFLREKDPIEKVKERLKKIKELKKKNERS